MPATVLYDFRSDTVTKPTAEMLQAMVSAPVGDAVFGDDPTVQRLEEVTAAELGKEDGLFVTTGTLSNQLAMRLHVGPLDEVLCDQEGRRDGGRGERWPRAIARCVRTIASGAPMVL